MVIPLLVVNEIDRATQRLAHGSAQSGLFAAWAAAWTTLQVVSYIPGGRVLGVAVAVVQVVAAITAVLLVMRITAEQEIAGSRCLEAGLRPRRPV